MIDEEFVAMVERDGVRFFIEKAHPISGLVAEDGRISHVGSNGFALMALCIAAERGMLSREEARSERISNSISARWAMALTEVPPLMVPTLKVVRPSAGSSMA